MAPQLLVAGHVARTVERCRGREFILVDQDTMVADYKAHPGTTGLGHISKDPKSRGFFVHSGFALSPQGQPLGLLSLRMWSRDPDTFGKSAELGRPFEEKESYKWVQCLKDVEAALDPTQKVVLVSDRESDLYDYIAVPRRANTHLLIRAVYPRCVEVDSNEEGKAAIPGKLFDVVANAPAGGTRKVTVPRKPGQPKRQAELTVQYLRLRVLCPSTRRKGEKGEPQELTAVRVIEMKPPEGEEAVEWVLLTTLTVAKEEDAWEIVRLYTLRWTIERFHYTLKSGCGIEKLQVDEAHRLMNTVALYCVVAWRLMALTYLGRTAPQAPVAEALSPTEVQVLSAREGRPITTAGEAVLALAKMGGFEPCPSAGHPGPKAVWTGLRKLAALAEGWQLAVATLGSAARPFQHDSVGFCEAR